MIRLPLTCAAMILGACSESTGSSGQQEPGSECGQVACPPEGEAPPRFLVFSKTEGYRHQSISTGTQAVRDIAVDAGWQVTATEDSTVFEASTLADISAVVFLSTTGNVLSDEEQEALRTFVEGGGGFIGIHSATDTETDWPWYGELLGARFAEHPQIQQARILVEDPTHPATVGLPAIWERTDEWYNFDVNPRPEAHVLLSLDETSYEGGTMQDHPIAWTRQQGAGRVFYTALGHTTDSFVEPKFLDHLAGGLRWVVGGE